MNQIAEISRLVEGYHAWVRERTVLRNIDSGWVEVTTPFLDRHNDHVQIFVRQFEGGYELMDDGETLRDLELSGCSLDSPKRKSMLEITLNGFGIDVEKGVLRVKATPQNFAARKHSLVQSITAVNDMFYTSTATVISLFKEEVANWFLSEEIRAVPDVQFTGKSGFQHRFDFAVPRSRTAPERIIKAVNRPNKDAALNLIMAWNDTHDQRPEGSQAYAILNDNEQTVSPSIMDALVEYDIKSVVWSRRAETRGLLAA